jgi:hypothetical protein
MYIRVYTVALFAMTFGRPASFFWSLDVLACVLLIADALMPFGVNIIVMLGDSTASSIMLMKKESHQLAASSATASQRKLLLSSL